MKALEGECGVWVAPSEPAERRRAYVRWLKERAKDSDRPRCVYHDHLSEQPCNDGCHYIKEGT